MGKGAGMQLERVRTVQKRVRSGGHSQKNDVLIML